MLLGLTSAKNLPDNIGEKLEEFLKDDMPDDHRVAPKPKDKRKSKKAKQLERAKRKRKLMNEVLAEENNNRVLQGKRPEFSLIPYYMGHIPDIEGSIVFFRHNPLYNF